MDNNPPISADELQIEFDRLKEVFRGDNSFAKFDASAEMMVLISRYLSNNIQSIDVEPITTVLEEYARIANGGKPEFIKSQKSAGGHPSDPGKQMNSASIVSSIDILAKNGYSVTETSCRPALPAPWVSQQFTNCFGTSLQANSAQGHVNFQQPKTVKAGESAPLYAECL